MPFSDSTLSREELSRYSRHIILKEFGLEGQKKLKTAKVLVIGAGGLGSPVLLYLAAAGVGTIGIVDFDVVDETNLQRQVLFTVQDIGKPKADIAAKRLLALNPFINTLTYPVQITSQNAFDIINHFDVVVDGTDNFQTRYLVNDACVLLNKPNVYGSIFQFEGQLSVFHYTDSNGVVGPNYRDLYPTPPPPGMVPSCAEGGVLGVLPGIIGSLQASETIKIITGIGKPLNGRLLLFDALNFETRIVKFSRDDNNPVNGKKPTINKLIDYDEFCGVKPPSSSQKQINELSVRDLKQWIDTKKDFQLIDVREPFEHDLVNIGGELIPLSKITENEEIISHSKPVVFYCKTGIRSARAIKELLAKGYLNLYNVTGGITAYTSDIDPSLPKY
ncbi:molybdopterin-synthase adenylyltransferase MoeB [bacterium]|nr:molybdopterin-synthase adenylyltransferase MoeB [bacterium]